MKPSPPPDVPGKTEFQRFDIAVRQVLTVSKDELLKRKERERKKRDKKRRPKKSWGVVAKTCHGRIPT